MKQSLFFVIMLIFLTACGLNSAPHNEIQAEQSAVVEAKNLTPEQSEAIEEYLKTVEQTLRDDGGFMKQRFNKPLKSSVPRKRKNFLNNKKSPNGEFFTLLHEDELR